MTPKSSPSTEVIAFASGKGGTGKTALITSLGYALRASDHRVLLIDADPATDGLSLFILGPSGINQIRNYKPENTFAGFFAGHATDNNYTIEPRIIHRLASDDHKLSYEALISGRGLYGGIPVQSVNETLLQLPSENKPAEFNFRNLDRATFQNAIFDLFTQLRERNEYDYILVDTRGGFSFESTDVCAAADSFIVVTEAHYTAFYQDRNLVNRIIDAAVQIKTKPLLRAFIVNKATQGNEESFRAALENEFKSSFAV